MSGMERKIISTNEAPGAIGPYSQAVLASGRFLFISGQIPLRPDGSLVEGDVAAQCEQVMANLEAILRASGMTFAHAVKTTILLSSMDHFATVNEIYGRRFSQEPPARATFSVVGLPKGVDVEIEMIAVC